MGTVERIDSQSQSLEGTSTATSVTDSQRPGRPPRRSQWGLAGALALVSCPIVLSGCIFGFLPLNVPQAPRPIATPAFAAGPSPTAQLELPDLPIADLPGAPAFAVWTPERNAQIRVSISRSGSLNGLLVVPLLNRDPMYLDHVRVSMSPTGKYFAVVEAADGPTITRAFVRIFSSGGDLVWTAPRQVTARPTIRWSPDSAHFAVDARLRWLVVTPTGAGQATVVEIDTRRPFAANGGVEYPWELLDFSEDGMTLYGSRSAGLRPYTYPLARVPTRGGPLEPLASLPTKPGLRLAALRTLIDNPLEAPIDPNTGRIAMPTSSGRSTDLDITVRAGTRDRHFTLSNVNGVDLAWQHGSLVILRSGTQTREQSLGVVSTGADLGKERRVASFPVVGQHARLVALTDGYVILAFGRGFGDVPNRLLLVRLSDGAKTVIDVDGLPKTVETFGFGGWQTP